MKIMDLITQQLKRFADDERAVSPVVGFVLIFALIMIVFTIYQAEVVPAQNTEIEFEHSQVVEGQMGRLSSAVIDTSSTDDPRSVTIDTGVHYPNRAFAINPGNPVGTLETVETKGVIVSGIESEYGNGTYTSDTSFIVYRPYYHYLGEETEYFIEHGMYLKHYSNSGVVGLESPGAMFSGSGTVNLILIDGKLEAREMTTTVITESVSTREITLSEKDSGTITLPTTLPKDQWSEVLNGTGHEIDTYYNDPGSINRVTIELEAGTTITVNRVSVGDPEPDGIDTKRYIENETSRTPTAVANTTEYLTVSVRDQFGTLITSGVTMEATTNGTGSLNTTSVTTSDGTATVAYHSTEADSGSTVGVIVSLKNGSVNGPVTFSLHYADENDGDDNEDNDGDGYVDEDDEDNGDDDDDNDGDGAIDEDDEGDD